ncbi:uncharacterized protein N7469_010088 [Penicillium citrinum]|uniref:Alpha/beta hydrolase fold-3 domain-containing protein n=1 Tax=Penicillium citrinum TaxID=5077 RepID=A0A9W9NJU4_PENCI|nr:uncharacterized protein N7469_010088 [Penicillium citrinum]KAJ5221201.1 hypothetical protein N7469_010088 [Penicillium citrinum]
MRALISHSCRQIFHARQIPKNPIVCFPRSRFASTCVEENVSVPVGNNGRVTLKITRPTTLTGHNISSGSEPSGPNVILYLPPGPLFGFMDEVHAPSWNRKHASLNSRDGNSTIPNTESLQHALACTTAATVVTVKYRLGNIGEIAQKAISSSQQISTDWPEPTSTNQAESKSYQYPTPIHDTIAGFDWIQDNLQPGQLGIYGSHIGGSLALMLALTEAQTVNAVAAADPICDWPGLDAYCIWKTGSVEPPTKRPKKRASRTVAPSDLVSLLDARRRFFPSFEKCFDKFASPILFLRSAGRDVPKNFPEYLTGAEYPVPVLQENSKTTCAESNETDYSISDSDVYSIDSEASEQNDVPTRRRKALSRWPPYGLDYGLSGNTSSRLGHGIRRLQVALPWVRVFSGGNKASSFESEELSKISTKDMNPEVAPTVLARQSEEMVSVMRRACFFGREKGYGERRVTLSRSDDDPGQAAANWLKEAFDGVLNDD